MMQKFESIYYANLKIQPYISCIEGKHPQIMIFNFKITTQQQQQHLLWYQLKGLNPTTEVIKRIYGTCCTNSRLSIKLEFEKQTFEDYVQIFSRPSRPQSLISSNTRDTSIKSSLIWLWQKPTYGSLCWYIEEI